MADRPIPKPPTVKLGEIELPQLINGQWQAGAGFGDVSVDRMVDAMLAAVEAGYGSFDLSPQSGGAEELFGVLRRRVEREYGARRADRMLQGLSKWLVHDWPSRHMQEPRVIAECEAKARRMQVERVDAVQLFWGESQLEGQPAMVETLRHMAKLQGSKLGAIIGCNMNLEQLVAAVDQGVVLAANQVQCSLVDARADQSGLAAYCHMHSIQLLGYGTLCGGLLTDRYLDRPPPHPNTPALGKHLQFIKLWGGWELFQTLLQALRQVATKHGVSIANVAVRAVLERRAIGAVIVGSRLGISDHLLENSRIFEFELDADDYRAIDAVTVQGRDMLLTLGDCGDEYR